MLKMMNYAALNNEYNWKDLCIQLKKWYTYTYDNITRFRKSPIFNPIGFYASS